jgi:hypothetical protein
MSKDFDHLLKQLVERIFKRYPSLAPIKKLRVLIKSAARNSPGLMFSRFKEALSIEGVSEAIANRDIKFFVDREGLLAPVAGLFSLSKSVTEDDVKRVWAVIDQLVECTSTDDVSIPALDESGWSELVSEILGQHISLPDCLREKASGLLALLVRFLDGQSEVELTSELDDLLDGVDLSAMLPAEERERGIDGSLLKTLLPHLQGLQAASEEDALRVSRDFLRSDSMKGVIKILRRMFRCVDSAMLVRLISDAINRLDVSSPEVLVASVQSLQNDDNIARGATMLMRTANVQALQSLVQDATQLVDPSVLQKVCNSGGNASSMLSKLLGSQATPDLVSRLPSVIGSDGSVDLAAVPGLMRGGRRKPRKPRLSASRLAN